MSARGCLALFMMTLSLSLVAAQPRISPGDMAGRERERFIENPAERFMKPGPYVEQPLIVQAPQTSKHKARRSHRKHR